jgi:hypothetical protein
VVQLGDEQNSLPQVPVDCCLNDSTAKNGPIVCRQQSRDNLGKRKWIINKTKYPVGHIEMRSRRDKQSLGRLLVSFS